MAKLSPPAPLGDSHDLDAFDCGVDSLDTWLRERARWNQDQGYTRTFVVCEANSGRVAGTYSLASGMIFRDEVPRRVRSQPAPRDIPIALLARLAVDVRHQGSGLGRSLLQSALMNTATAAQSVAFRAVVVDALDEGAAGFYRRYGFVPTRIHPLKLILPIQHLVASMREAAGE